MKTAMNQYNNTPDRYPALAGADQREKYCCQIAVSEEFIYFCRHPHVLRYEHAGVYGVSVCVGVCRCVHAVGKREADIKQTSPESNRFVGTHHSSQLACNYRPCNVLLARAVVTSVHRTPRWLAPNWTRFRANLFHQHKTERPAGFGVNNSNECRRNRSNNKSDATIFLFLISFVFILF